MPFTDDAPGTSRRRQSKEDRLLCKDVGIDLAQSLDARGFRELQPTPQMEDIDLHFLIMVLAIKSLDHHSQLSILHTELLGQLLSELFDLFIQRDGI